MFGDNQFRYALLSLAACEAPLQLHIGGFRWVPAERVPTTGRLHALKLATTSWTGAPTAVPGQHPSMLQRRHPSAGAAWRHAGLPLMRLWLGGRSGEPPGFPYGNRVVFVANDWHAGLVPSYLAGKYRRSGVYTVQPRGPQCGPTAVPAHCSHVARATAAHASNHGSGAGAGTTRPCPCAAADAVQDARCIFAIHNLSHQGVEPAATYANFGLPEDWCAPCPCCYHSGCTCRTGSQESRCPSSLPAGHAWAPDCTWLPGGSSRGMRQVWLMARACCPPCRAVRKAVRKRDVAVGCRYDPLSWEYPSWASINGPAVNILKGALLASDRIVTVSQARAVRVACLHALCIAQSWSAASLVTCITPLPAAARLCRAYQ